MTNIRAFVGHSFLEEDREVVERITKILDQLKLSLPSFDWTHALPAEPIPISQKVRNVMGGCNVFIGICTKGELAVKEPLLNGAFGYLFGQRKSFQWKTSDWILQEIGCAIGLGLHVVLILEEGVRNPGGLQGDLNWIGLSRDNPEAITTNLLQMFNYISGKSNSFPVPAVTQSGQLTIVQNQETGQAETPTPSWLIEDYKFGFMEALLNDDEKQAAYIQEAYIKSAIAEADGKNVKWFAWAEYTRMNWGKGGSLQGLQNIVEAAPDNAEAHEFLALGLQKFDEQRRAAEEFEAAARLQNDVPQKVRLLGRAAVAHINCQDNESSERNIKAMKECSRSKKTEESLYLSLGEIAETRKNNEFQMSIMEQMLVENPADTETRFALALKYSETGQDNLSLYHHLKIPEASRSAMAWNNLGVSYDRLKMPHKAVGAYKRAESKNVSLAMSNLARKLLNAGFGDEARDRCKTAMEIEGYDKHVPETLALIQKQEDDETEQQDKKLEGAKAISEFYSLYGASSINVDASTFYGMWKGPKCSLQVSIKGKEFQAYGTYDKPGQMTLGGFLSSLPSVQMQIEYRGTISGNAIHATVSEKRTDGLETASLFLLGDADRKALLILTPNQKKLFVMDNCDFSKPEFYCLEKEPPVLSAGTAN